MVPRAKLYSRCPVFPPLTFCVYPESPCHRRCLSFNLFFAHMKVKFCCGSKKPAPIVMKPTLSSSFLVSVCACFYFFLCEPPQHERLIAKWRAILFRAAKNQISKGDLHALPKPLHKLASPLLFMTGGVGRGGEGAPCGRLKPLLDL